MVIICFMLFAESLPKWVKLIIYVNFMIKIYAQFVKIRVENNNR